MCSPLLNLSHRLFGSVPYFVSGKESAIKPEGTLLPPLRWPTLALQAILASSAVIIPDRSGNHIKKKKKSDEDSQALKQPENSQTPG